METQTQAPETQGKPENPINNNQETKQTLQKLLRRKAGYGQHTSPQNCTPTIRRQTDEVSLQEIASAAILLGTVELSSVWITLPTFPLSVYGAIGLLYIILAAVMIVIYT